MSVTCMQLCPDLTKRDLLDVQAVSEGLSNGSPLGCVKEAHSAACCGHPHFNNCNRVVGQAEHLAVQELCPQTCMYVEEAGCRVAWSVAQECPYMICLLGI